MKHPPTAVSNGLLCCLTLLLAGINLVAAEGENSVPRERISFNAGWRFAQGDPANTTGLSYAELKPWLLPVAHEFITNAPAGRPHGNPGENVAFTRADFDDSGWRALDLPHDWAIEGPFDQQLPGETAKLPYAGVAWYRKSFTLPQSDAGRHLALEVDGAMSYSAVWLNGRFIGGWPYGYSSWRLDLTPHLNLNGTNVLAIRLDNPPHSSRWYPGAGLYRNVWLVKTAPVHVRHWGVAITTPHVTRAAAEVHHAVSVVNRSRLSAAVKVSSLIYELNTHGQKSLAPVASHAGTQIKLASGETVTPEFNAVVWQPKLWSPATPQRYVAVTTLEQEGRVSDVVETPFGIRTFQFTTTNGLVFNGARLPIQGVCLHHDFGALGAALNLRALERQLELMRALGANAIRSSHNPAAPELLDLCDRMGFLVMEEAFDAWRMTKRTNDYSVLFDDWHEADLRAMIRRGRNHPSIVLWSLGNEVYEQREGTNAWLAEKLAAIAHDEDPTRPVNMALHVVAASTNGFQKAVDVFGYNYTPFGYAAFRSNNPAIPLIGSETTSTVSSRGEYYFPVSTNRRDGRMDFQATSYDYAAPAWAYMPDTEFKAQDENPFVAGEFVWTGLDYLGEPTPYDNDTTNRLRFTDPQLQARMDALLAAGKRIPVPSRSSYFGILDLCGFPKDRFYLYQARWRPELPMAHILPHWNWPERTNQVTPVHVYTSGDEAELFLNGKPLGRKQRGPFDYRLRWDDVVYHPGTLKVVVYKHGKRWATDVMNTAGPAAKIELAPDRKLIKADGQDLCFVTATIADQSGQLVPRSSHRVRFSVEGPGDIIATDNGDATSHEPFQQDHRAAYNGLCLAVVRSKAGEAGKIVLRAEAEGLKSREIVIRSK
jgi:beta-galactosidase